MIEGAESMTNKRTVILGLTLASALTVLPSRADEGLPDDERGLWIGSRVRLETDNAPGVRVMGNVVAMDDESLHLKPAVGSARDMRVPWESISGLEAVRGRRTLVGEGAAVGAVCGAVIGGLFGAWARQMGCEGTCSINPLGAVLAGAGIVSVPGALVGVIVGGSIPSDRWERVPPADWRMRSSSTPGRKGVRLALSVRF